MKFYAHLMQHALILTLLIPNSFEMPVLKYDPSYYYGPDINAKVFSDAINELSVGEPNRKRRQLDDVDYYDERQLFASPEFQRILPMHVEEMLRSPQLQKALDMYLKQAYGPYSTSVLDAQIYEYLYPGATSHGSYRRTLAANSQERDEELDDYDYAEVPNEVDPQTDSNRRTFGLLINGVMGILNQAGIGGSTTTQVEMERQTQLENQRKQELQQLTTIEQMRTQSALENIRQENVQEALRSRAQVDTLKTQLNSLSDQRERERRDKEELRLRLEFETQQREREKDDLKKKLDTESTIRERELFMMQQQLQQSSAKKDLETLEMQKRMELDRMRLELEMKNKFDLDTKLEMQRKQLEQSKMDYQNQMTMDSIMQKNAMSMMNQHTINNYRNN